MILWDTLTQLYSHSIAPSKLMNAWCLAANNVVQLDIKAFVSRWTGCPPEAVSFLPRSPAAVQYPSARGSRSHRRQRQSVANPFAIASSRATVGQSTKHIEIDIICSKKTSSLVHFSLFCATSSTTNLITLRIRVMEINIFRSLY